MSQEKLYSVFPTRYNTNHAAQPQKMAIGLKFWIKETGGLYYLFSKNKGNDQLHGNCVFVFAYAKSRFSHMRLGFSLVCYLKPCWPGCYGNIAMVLNLMT